MNIRLKRNTVVKGKPHLEGEIVKDVPDAEARYLIGIGKAEEEKSVIITEQPEIETADLKVEMETADVKSPRRKRG